MFLLNACILLSLELLDVFMWCYRVWKRPSWRSKELVTGIGVRTRDAASGRSWRGSGVRLGYLFKVKSGDDTGLAVGIISWVTRANEFQARDLRD